MSLNGQQEMKRITTTTTRISRKAFHQATQAEPLNSLKRNNPDAVLQLPFWPRHAQPGFLAIKAFHAEIDAIPLAVSRSGKTVIAQMRYQWWRDAIQGCYQQDVDTPSNHPLIQVLKPLIKTHKLSKYHFTRIINGSVKSPSILFLFLENETDARSFQETHYLDPRFTNLGELVSHSQSTTYAVLSLLAQLLFSNGPQPALPLATVDHGLSHLGTFLTIVRLLKRMPYYMRHRQTHIIPPELMACPEESLFRFFNPRPAKLYSSSSPSTHEPSSSDHPRSSLLNLVFLAYSELVAAREVISLDPSHSHHPDFRSSKSAQQIEKHIFEGPRSHLPKVRMDRTLMPLFLPAVSHVFCSRVHPFIRCSLISTFSFCSLVWRRRRGASSAGSPRSSLPITTAGLVVRSHTKQT
ncbi:hypothetical protein VP01_930g8 [Puccinia sorghi]|uniref:Uncharacterized protein n=1 Tax=Puccinia sorghi TaxID=27349 RepID=A0A0L6U7G5_9BASI|nr:hypothetical protein VP01_930g8 [Puccinia sorghi]